MAFQSCRQVAYIVMPCGRCSRLQFLNFKTEISWFGFHTRFQRHRGQLLRQRPSELVLTLRRPCRCLLRQQTLRRRYAFFLSIVGFQSYFKQVDSWNFLLFEKTSGLTGLYGTKLGRGSLASIHSTVIRLPVQVLILSQQPISIDITAGQSSSQLYKEQVHLEALRVPPLSIPSNSKLGTLASSRVLMSAQRGSSVRNRSHSLFVENSTWRISSSYFVSGTLPARHAPGHADVVLEHSEQQGCLVFVVPS